MIDSYSSLAVLCNCLMTLPQLLNEGLCSHFCGDAPIIDKITLEIGSSLTFSQQQHLLKICRLLVSYNNY